MKAMASPSSGSTASLALERAAPTRAPLVDSLPLESAAACAHNSFSVQRYWKLVHL